MEKGYVTPNTAHELLRQSRMEFDAFGYIPSATAVRLSALNYNVAQLERSYREAA